MPRARWSTPGATLNLLDPDGTTALVVAIINGHYDVAAMLADKGADPNIADTAGMAALYAAVDMNTLGEVYGRPAAQVHEPGVGARPDEGAAGARRQSERAAQVADAAARPHAGRPALGARHDAADARGQERRLRGDRRFCSTTAPIRRSRSATARRR